MDTPDHKTWLNESDHKALVRAARNMCRNEIEAEDLVQETYLRAFAGPPVEMIERPHAWMVRIMGNLVIDRSRKQSRSPKVVALDHRSIAAPEDEPSPSWLDVGTEELRDAIDELKSIYAVVLRLYYAEQRSHEEISRMLGIAPNTVASRLSRGRSALKQILRRRVVS